MHVHVHFRAGETGFGTRHFWAGSVAKGMSDPSPHYTLLLSNHQTSERLKIELFDLPFPGARSYRVRVNGEWARKLPLASKTMVAKRLRRWLVKH